MGGSGRGSARLRSRARAMGTKREYAPVFFPTSRPATGKSASALEGGRRPRVVERSVLLGPNRVRGEPPGVYHRGVIGSYKHMGDGRVREPGDGIGSRRSHLLSARRALLAEIDVVVRVALLRRRTRRSRSHGRTCAVTQPATAARRSKNSAARTRGYSHRGRKTERAKRLLVIPGGLGYVEPAHRPGGPSCALSAV